MTRTQSQRSDLVLICLSSEEAMALIELGAALEPFIAQGSPADRATAKMDEQVAAQILPRSQLVECVAETLTTALDDYLPAHVTEQDMLDAASQAVDQVLGYYESVGGGR